MDIRAALQEQYHAGLAMLRQSVEKCPEDLWASPIKRWDDGDRIIYRPFWRIAFHTVYFTHLYLGQGEAAFQPPPDTLAVKQRDDCQGLWQPGWDLEPYELPEDAKQATKEDVIAYIDHVKTLIDPTVDNLDLDTEDSGFPWYKRITKLSHQILNIRHLQGHVGQLSELLFERGIDTDWMSRRPA